MFDRPRGPRPFAHPGAEARLLHDARRLALEPMVEPADGLLQETDRGAGPRHMRPGMGPGPDQRLLRPWQVLHQGQDRFRVIVLPAADRVDGAADAPVILADRARLPIGVAALMREPGLDRHRHLLEPLEPLRAPARAGDLRQRRARGAGEECRPPRDVPVDQAAAHIVAVAIVAVLGRAHGDDGGERRGRERRDLQRVEAAPADAPHADLAAAPGLPCQPGDDLDAVLLLGEVVFVADDALGVARAADVDAHGRVAMAGEIGLRDRVAIDGAVAQPIGQIFEHGWHRVALGVLGQPDPRGEADAVGHRDPLRRDLADGTGKIADMSHAWRALQSGSAMSQPNSAAACSRNSAKETASVLGTRRSKLGASSAW